MLPLLALTQGDPAGVGPQIALAALAAAEPAEEGWRPLLVAERAALAAARSAVPAFDWDRLDFLPAGARLEEVSPARLAAPGRVPVIDPVGLDRALTPGRPEAADARGALAALELGAGLAERGAVAALVTCPLSKEGIARHVLPGFTGHTDYLARRAGLERYGRDYLMAFLAPDLRVALLSTHMPLARAVDGVTAEALVAALVCLDRHAPALARREGGGERLRIAVAGLDPHAGEGGLLGSADAERVAPAVAAARELGVDAVGPESADSLFARARRGEFDWVLALYHDQGLIAVKTAAFGEATNWTLGLPYLRTSVDHGTAYAAAASRTADHRPLSAVLRTTLELLANRPGV